MADQEELVYLHCRNCMPQKPGNVSPADWSQLEVGLHRKHVQVEIWCRRCTLLVARLSLSSPVPGIQCEACDEPT
jgi:hypothetical protein